MNNHRDNTAEPSSGVAQTRQHLQITVGEQVQKDGTVYRISQVLDFETVIGIAVESGRSCPLRISELTPLNSGSAPPEQDMILPSNSGHWFKRSFGLQRPLG